VDGVDFDVRRGEIFCLVGESGCGKTTTGKALLKLVEATDGDVLFEMPKKEYDAYVEVQSRVDAPERGQEVEELRRKYSITWRERRPWSPRDFAWLGIILLAGFVIATVVPAAILGWLTNPYTDSFKTICHAFATGLLLGVVASLPPARPARRMPLVITVLAFVASIVASIPAVYVHASIAAIGASFDIGTALATPWNRDLFGMIVALPFSAIAAGGMSALVLGARNRTEALTGIRMRTLRKRLQLIFQDPYESLNPKQSVYEIVSEPLRVNRFAMSPEEITALVTSSLEDVGLRPAGEFVFRFPHELSGGQRQRVSIAAALVLQPDFIVADEPVSMLDVSIRTEILQLMLDLRKSRNLTYLFITHDLSLAWVLADRIAVMYLGKIVEIGTTEQIIGQPKHPYTKALISVVPSPDPRHKVERIILKGERPDPVNIPPGCRFHPRCPVAFEKCGWSASEVAEELRSLQGAGILQGIASVSEVEVDSVALIPAEGTKADALVENLHSSLDAQRETRLALKGIAEIRADGGRVRLSLHAWSEPPLVEVTAGNAVACHLVTPPQDAAGGVTA